jgi:chemotaxis protein MotB
MALFIVQWLMNSGDKVKQSVAGYFRDPRGYTTTPGAGPGDSGEGLKVHRANVQDIRGQIEVALKGVPEFGSMRDSIKLSVTGEGLRIDLLENEQGCSS